MHKCVKRIKASSFFQLVVVAICLGLSASVYADYELQPFGFNGCDLQTDGPLRENVTLQDMIDLATAANAQAFTYQPQLQYGQLFQNPFPSDCQSDPSLSWPLYIDSDWSAVELAPVPVNSTLSLMLLALLVMSFGGLILMRQR